MKFWNRSQALTCLVVVFAFGRLLSGCGSSGGGGGNGGGGVQIPAVPTGVTATPGNAQVVLTWSEAANGLSPAPTFHVKRSTTSGGPYTQVGAPTAATYTDTGLTNGTAYYYVVSAVNSAGESANSLEVTATPLAAPPVSTGKGTGYTALAERDAKPAQSPAPAPPASAPPASVPPAAVASEQAEPPPAAATPPPGAPAEQRVVALSPPPASVSPPGSRGFVWPVHGQVISEYGSTGKGQHNDGINIAVPRGTPVVAADDGVVAYAGNELRGFGNLLLIRHSDGWMTAYAHNDTLLVKRGQSVRRGQEIATVGDSGGVSQPQLHFEVRQGTRAVDPMSFLGGKVNPASSAGGATPG